MPRSVVCAPVKFGEALRIGERHAAPAALVQVCQICGAVFAGKYDERVFVRSA